MDDATQPIVAMVLFAVWLLVGFGIRSLVALRRTGDSGWRGIRGQPNSVEWWAGILLAAALLAGAAAPVAALAGLEPLVTSTPLAVLGVVVTVVGIAATLATQIAMGDSWRVGVDPGEHTTLVTDGPFRVVRNPVFSAVWLTAVGLTLIVSNVVSLAALILVIVAIEMQVRAVEEPHLARQHGTTYLAYAARVGRFVPGVGLRSP